MADADLTAAKTQGQNMQNYQMAMQLGVAPMGMSSDEPYPEQGYEGPVEPDEYQG